MMLLRGMLCFIVTMWAGFSIVRYFISGERKISKELLLNLAIFIGVGIAFVDFIIRIW